MNKVWHNITEKFNTFDELKEQLFGSFEDKLPELSELSVGYIEKGAKRWIENDKDLNAMYKAFRPEDEIVLWCDGYSSEESKKDVGKKRT